MHEQQQNKPRIAVIGVGAMGSVYAGNFAEAGFDVQVVDVWADHINAISQDGLRLEGASGNRVITNIRAVLDIKDIGPCDLYVIATKADGVGAAAAAIAGVMTPDSLVLTIQNGLGAGERIAQHMTTEMFCWVSLRGLVLRLKGPDMFIIMPCGLSE